MAIEVFNRFEYKYCIDEKTLTRVIDEIEKHMVTDSYCKNHSLYTIANIYYDTNDSYLIRRSLSKPPYKEKLRLRSYGVPDMGSEAYLEIKKKVKGLVNKRRTALKLGEAYDFVKSGVKPVEKEYMNGQVLNELEYFLRIHDVAPKTYIAYDRLAYFGKGSDDLRISFDTNIRSRRNELRLELGDHGSLLLDKGLYIMEIKTSLAMPVWLADMLTELGIRRTSFSKYGTEYKEYLTHGTGRRFYPALARSGEGLAAAL